MFPRSLEGIPPVVVEVAWHFGVAGASFPRWSAPGSGRDLWSTESTRAEWQDRRIRFGVGWWGGRAKKGLMSNAMLRRLLNVHDDLDLKHMIIGGENHPPRLFCHRC